MLNARTRQGRASSSSGHVPCANPESWRHGTGRRDGPRTNGTDTRLPRAQGGGGIELGRLLYEPGGVLARKPLDEQHRVTELPVKAAVGNAAYRQGCRQIAGRRSRCAPAVAPLRLKGDAWVHAD